MASERKVEAGRIYQDMYEYLGSVLYKKNILGLGIALYAHDTEAKEAFFEYGFGMRCKDQIRLISEEMPIRNNDMIAEGILSFEELELKDFPLLTGYRDMLKDHLLEELQVTQPTLSHHMKVLSDCGLVSSYKDGKWQHYSINCEKFKEYKDYITAITCCGDTSEDKNSEGCCGTKKEQSSVAPKTNRKG